MVGSGLLVRGSAQQADDDSNQAKLEQPVAGMHRSRDRADPLPDHRTGQQDDREADPRDQRQYKGMADLELTTTRAHWAAPFPKTSVALRNQMQDVMSCMKKDGTIAKMSEKWFGHPPAADALERVVTPGYGVPGMPGYDPTPHELKCS